VDAQSKQLSDAPDNNLINADIFLVLLQQQLTPTVKI
jgi:hypothetical protein